MQDCKWTADVNIDVVISTVVVNDKIHAGLLVMSSESLYLRVQINEVPVVWFPLHFCQKSRSNRHD